MNAILTKPPDVPTGKIQTFGELGPKYQVGKPIRELGNGDWMIHITLVETGEETEYPYSRLCEDPEAYGCTRLRLI